jgi:cytochrome o ubiquinol oxidase subunit III
MSGAGVAVSGARSNPNPKPRDQTGTGESGPASKRIITGYGFWIFLLSDIIMFSALFAVYVVLTGATAGGPAGRELFDLHRVAIETACLLASSFTCGLASVAVSMRKPWPAQLAFAVTGVLGASFLALEINEFVGMVARGAGPTRSAFLSAFFTLVGAHGAHVGVGLLWLGTMMAQLYAKGFRDDIQRRILCFSLFWHALDIIWVALFTIVYLMSAA